MIGQRVENSEQFQFASFYKSHLRAVQALVGRYRFADAAADDLVQEIFAAAWEKKEGMRKPEARSGWLMAIARNACLSEIRKRRNFISIAPTDASDSEEGADWEVVLEASDDSESRHLEFSLALITEIIMNHKHPTRALVARLYYREGLSVVEISDKLEINQNTILSHLRRFRLVASKAMLSLMAENRML